jgi:nucleotide-binding universal stress UspA family protein
VALVHALEVEPEYEALVEKKEVHGAITSWLEGLRDHLVGDGVKVRQLQCKRGKAFREIVTAAEDLDAGLIVLGARGTSSPHLFQMGTTAEKAIRTAARPVLVVHSERPVNFGNILCPVDFSSASALALTHAIRLAQGLRGARLQVMTVLALPMLTPGLGLGGSQRSVEAERATLARCDEEFDRFLGEFDLRQLEWEKRVARGDPAQEIVAAALGWRAGLVVMGAVGRTGLPHILMGSVSLKVGRLLPCSLLTVPQEQVGLDRLQQNIDDINAACRQGQDCLARGFHEDALAWFGRCLYLNPYFAPALEGKAAAHDQLGHQEQAERCRQHAELLRRELGNQ